ncbi:hypothetical protein N9092_03640 [Akkermansiaceae bacterium]|nr:hypothetical protein [Akkermansiaceae bacterium]
MEEEIIKFEEDLNKIEFDNCPIGALVVDALIIEVFNQQPVLSLFERCKDLVRLWRFRAISNRYFFRKKEKKELGDFLSIHKNKPILTFISNKRANLFRINHEILKAIGPSNAICFFKEKVTFKTLETEAPLVTLDDSQIDWGCSSDWEGHFNVVDKKIKISIKKFIKQTGIPRYFVKRIYFLLIVQTQRLHSHRILLKSLNPKFVLVEYDRGSWSSPLVLAAKRVGIKTFSHTHGIISSKVAYLPLVADFLFCWGPRQKEIFESYGGPKLKIVVTGATQLSRGQPLDKCSLKKKISVDKAHKVVLFATQPMPNILKLVELFCRGIYNQDKVVGIVRMHPSERKSDYQRLASRYPDILFDSGEVFSFEESLSLADLVCIYNSAFGLDAIMRGRGLCVLNPPGCGVDAKNDFVENGKIPEIQSAKQFGFFLEKWVKSEIVQRKLETLSVKYASDYCVDTGQDAASNCLEFIEKNH